MPLGVAAEDTNRGRGHHLHGIQAISIDIRTNCLNTIAVVDSVGTTRQCVLPEGALRAQAVHLEALHAPR